MNVPLTPRPAHRGTPHNGTAKRREERGERREKRERERRHTDTTHVLVQEVRHLPGHNSQLLVHDGRRHGGRWGVSSSCV